MANGRATTDLEIFDEDFLRGEKTSRLRNVSFFVLCATIVTATVAYGAVDNWATAMLAIFAGIIGLLWLTDAFLGQEFDFSVNSIQLPLVGLLLLGFFQLLPLWNPNIPPDLLAAPSIKTFTLDPHSTKFFVTLLGVYTIFFAASLTLLENYRRRQAMVFTLIVFGSVMAFFGVIQSMANPNSNSVLGLREHAGALPFATFINRHHFASLMNMGIGLTLGLLYGDATKKDKRLLLVIAIGLMGIAVLLTSSRGAMLSLFGVVGFVVLLNLLKGRSELSDDDENKRSFFSVQNILLIGSGLGLLLVLIGAALFFGGESAVSRGIGLDSQADISNGRFHFWNVAWQIFLNNPILGTGFDSFGTAFPKYDTWNGFWRVEQAHNDYLQILADAGIVGFTCVAAFVFLLFKKALRVISHTEDAFRRGTAIGALAGCFGILIHSFFDFPLRTPANALFFLTLAALAVVGGGYVPPTRKRNRHRVEKHSAAQHG